MRAFASQAAGRGPSRSTRSVHTLSESPFTLGSVEIHWRAKRGRNRTKAEVAGSFTVFSRECETFLEDILRVTSTVVYERACTFRLPFPAGKRPEIPDFFFRDRKSFWAEIAWLTDKEVGRGRSKAFAGIQLDTTPLPRQALAV